MNLVRITDVHDPRIAAYRDIRERDLVGRQGLFIAEGKVVLDVLFSARRFEAESVLVLESRLAGLENILAAAPLDLPVYAVSAAVMDKISGFPMHRGILAVGRRPPDSDDRLLTEDLPKKATVVVAVGVSNHDNMGAIFRNAAAFAADAILMDRTCCDPLYRKAIRVSVGAVLKVPFARFETAGEIVDDLARRRFGQFALSPRGVIDIADLVRPDRAALYLGGEGNGLPAGLMDRLQTVHIPIAEGFDSLNVAAASAVALHRLWSGARKG